MKNTSLIDYWASNEGVAVFTLDNPPLNLNTRAMTDRLLDLTSRIADDEGTRVVVVTGAGERAFCAGSDVAEFPHVRDEVVSKKLRRENAAFTAVEQLPQPVVAALNGATLGGGAEIALACDIRIIDQEASIGFPEVNLGVFPGSGGVFRLPRLVGLARAYELLYTGEPIDAHEAHRIGLVNRTAPHGEALSTALSLAHNIAAKPALSLSLIRSAARDSLVQTTEEATQRTLEDSHRVFSSSDLDEGMAAFFEKRTPRFPASRQDPTVRR